MEIVNWFIDSILLVVHVFFSFAPRWLGSLSWPPAMGAAMLWVFGRTSNQERMKQVKRRIQAGLLELRVFVDEPAISLRAQGGPDRRQPALSRPGSASGVVDGRADRLCC